MSYSAQDVDEIQRRRRRKVDPGMWVLVLTATAYAIAFAYEDGYLRNFNIPTEFVEVDLRELLICAAAAAIVAAFALPWVVAQTVQAGYLPQMQSRQALLTVFISLTLGLSFAYGGHNITAGAVCILSAMTLVLLPNLPHVLRRDSWLAKFSVAEAALLERLAQASMMPVLGIAVVSPLLAFQLGRYSADLQEVFLVPENLPNCLVLRNSSSGLLCATIDPNSYILNGEYRFLKTEGAVLRRLSFQRTPHSGLWLLAPNSPLPLVRSECFSGATAPRANLDGRRGPASSDLSAKAPPAHSAPARPSPH